MGEVYRAWDDALDRVVALKLLLPLRAESPAAVKRFHREARLAARVNHPNVAHVYDVGTFEDSPFMAMEFVPGRQLRSEMSGRLPPERVVFLARQILDGLSEAHRQGVVHRDLKPENILISGRDQVKILDFGLAKPVFDDAGESLDLSTTGLTGTPRYMAPEQIQGGTIDPRTDVYALGCVIYEMIAGSPAHTGNTLGEMLLSVVHKNAAKLTEAMCPPALAAVVERALEKQQDQRFRDAEAMLAELRDMERTPLPPAPVQSAERPPHPRAAVYAQRGREALNGISSSSSLAVDMIEEALRLDPDYAIAHAIHAEACAALFNTSRAAARWLDKAQASLERAEALDPSLPDVRVARARIVWTKTFNFPAETALRELRLALHADPDHIGALRLWSTITAHVGLFDHAEGAIARRLAMDPQDEVMRSLSASLAIAHGRPERALQMLSPLLRLDPHHEDTLFWWVHAHALVAAGRHVEAGPILEASLARRPDDPLSLSLSAVVAALDGDATEARARSQKALGSLRGELHPHHAHHLVACAESVLGDIEEALHWLGRTANEGMPCYPWFAQDPLLENLRRSPAGAELMRDLARRYAYYQREFPLNDPATLSLVATQVGG